METSIWSEEQLKTFYEKVLIDLGPTETDFFCIAARKKYMTEDERKSTGLGDTCMMNKTILKDHNFKKFLSKVKQSDACCDYFLDHNDNYIPRHSLVFYVNLNHTNVLTAIKEFKKLLADWDYDVASLIDFKNHNKVDAIGKQLKTIQNNLLKSFQDPKHTNKKWVDIDCDVEVFSPECFSTLKEVIKNRLGMECYVVKTHGGCHVLVNYDSISEVNKKIAEQTEDKKSIREKIVTANKILNVVREFFEENKVDSKEIKINQNMMIPMPGTLQGGFRVEVI